MTLTPPPEKLNRIWIGGKGAAAGEQPSRAPMHSLVRTLAFLPLFPSCLTTFVIGAIKLSTHCAKRGLRAEAGGRRRVSRDYSDFGNVEIFGYSAYRIANAFSSPQMPPCWDTTSQRVTLQAIMPLTVKVG